MRIKGLLNYQLCYKDRKAIIKEIRFPFDIKSILKEYDRNVVHDGLFNYYRKLKEFKKWINQKVKNGPINFVEFSDKQSETTNMFIVMEKEQVIMNCIKECSK